MTTGVGGNANPRDPAQQAMTLPRGRGGGDRAGCGWFFSLAASGQSHGVRPRHHASWGRLCADFLGPWMLMGGFEVSARGLPCGSSAGN